MTAVFKWGVCFGLLGLALLLYYPRPEMGFVLDDQYVIERNPLIKNPALYPQIFTSGLFDAARSVAEGQLNYYRPLLTASFAVDYAVWGLKPFGYRLTNLLIHALNSCLVFWFLFLFFRRKNLAAVAALIFCILPVHEWAVRYITGRGDLLQATFSLLSLIAFVYHLTSGRKRFLLISLTMFTAALLCREVTALNVLYVALIAVKLSGDVRRSLMLTSLFGGTVLIYYVWRASTFPVFGQGLANNIGSNLFSGVASGVAFLSHVLVPASVAAQVPAIVGFLSIAVVMAGLLGLATSKEREDRFFATGFVAISFVILIITFVMARVIAQHIGPVMSEHFLYFPSTGFAFLAAFWIGRLPNTDARVAACALAVSYFSLLTLVGGWFWKNEERVLRNVKRIEGSRLTLFDQQLAMKYDDDLEQISAFAHAEKHPPKQSMWLKRMGHVFHQQKDYGQAEAFLQYAVTVDSLNFEAWNELAALYTETGRFDMSLECLEKSLEAKPHTADTYRLKGVALYWRGDYAAAVDVLKQALSYDPDQQDAQQYLMMARYFLGQEDAYQSVVDQAMRRSSEALLTLKFVVRELLEKGHRAQAFKIFADHSWLFEHDPEFADFVAWARQHNISHE